MSNSRRFRPSVPSRAAGAAAGIVIGLWAHAALAGNALIGLTVGGSTDALVSVNPATGVITTIANGLPDGLSDDAFALDSADGQFFYQNGGQLDVVNTTTGALLGSRSLSTTLSGMSYDPVSQTLLGLAVGGSSDALVSINTATGAITTIASNLPVGLSNSVHAVNPANGEFFYQANGKLNVVNSTTGALLGTYSLSNTLDSLSYDSITGQLLALTYGGNDDELSSVNPSTGAITNLGSNDLPPYLTDNAYALDATDGQFFYQSINQLIVVNVTTGAELASRSLANTLNIIAAPDPTAAPEPAGVAVLLAGLGILGVFRHRPRRR